MEVWLGRIVINGFIITALLYLFLFIFFFRKHRDDFEYTVVVCFLIVLLWFVPWGIFFLVPVSIVVSLISPASRLKWKEKIVPRSVTSVILLLILILGSLIPPSLPVGDDSWILVSEENPDSWPWPASEQYTYLHDGKVISILNTRIPHTFSVYGSAQSSLSIALTLGLDDLRLKQSIDQLGINPESFALEPIVADSKHTYNDKEYHVLRERIFLESVDSLTLGYVLIVAIPSVGGELTILSIVRTSLDDIDVWEEKIVNDFLLLHQ